MSQMNPAHVTWNVLWELCHTLTVTGSTKQIEINCLACGIMGAVISVQKLQLWTMVEDIHFLLSLPINDTTHYNFSFLEPLSALVDLINKCNYIPPHYQSLHTAPLVSPTKKPSSNISYCCATPLREEVLAVMCAWCCLRTLKLKSVNGHRRTRTGGGSKEIKLKYKQGKGRTNVRKKQT
jgi:hypothetical protein